jgi:hypothetical protein
MMLVIQSGKEGLTCQWNLVYERIIIGRVKLRYQ